MKKSLSKLNLLRFNSIFLAKQIEAAKYQKPTVFRKPTEFEESPDPEFRRIVGLNLDKKGIST